MKARRAVVAAGPNDAHVALERAERLLAPGASLTILTSCRGSVPKRPAPRSAQTSGPDPPEVYFTHLSLKNLGRRRTGSLGPRTRARTQELRTPRTRGPLYFPWLLRPWFQRVHITRCNMLKMGPRHRSRPGS